MPKLAWAVLCSKSLLDQRTNQISLIDIIEYVEFSPSKSDRKRMKARQILALPIASQVVSMWQRSNDEVPETFEVGVVVELPDGKEVPSPTTLQAEVTSMRLRVIMRMPRLPYRDSGIHRIIIRQRPSKQAEWIEAGSVMVEIREREAPKKEQGNEKPMATTKRRGRH